jgi:predicted Zn-dependent protease
MSPYRLAVVCAVLSLSGSGCRTARAVERAVADVLIPDETEARLGQQVHQQLVAEREPFVEDAALDEALGRVATPVLHAAEQDRPGTPWKLHVLNAPGTVNAFATPGGYLYVYTGLLLAVEDEAELAGVLAHEAGHVVARHAARQMVSALGLEVVAGLALGQDPAVLAQVAATLAAQGALRAHSRADEAEADALAVRYSAAAGYDPRGLASFFEKLARQEPGLPRALTWLSTHPAPPDRVADVEARAAREGLTGKRDLQGALPTLKARARALGPAPAPR